MKTLLRGLSFLLLSCTPTSQKETAASEEAIASERPSDLKLDYKYIGKAVEKEDTHVWGSSPVRGKDGKMHLYVAEWPKPTNKEEGFSGWYKHSQIAHYVADKPEGLYGFLRISVADENNGFNAPHNPTIQYLDGRYVLCFIVNENNDKRTQRIIMYVADDLSDENWRPAVSALADGTILEAPKDSTLWNYKTYRGVTNPSLVKFGEQYLLYFKSVIPHPEDSTLNPNNDRHNYRTSDYSYGVAIAENLEGPYTIQPQRVTAKGVELEDVYAFTYKSKVYLLSRDMKGSLGSSGGGLLWVSEDGLMFSKEQVTRAFEDLEAYIGEEALRATAIYRGQKEGHLERPQILIEEGEPTYLFVATGTNDSTHYGSCSYVFKLQTGE